jgi:hypothetical protein
MKPLFLLFLFFSTAIATASTMKVDFQCVPSETQTIYKDTFLVRINSDGTAKVLYKRTSNKIDFNTTTKYEYIPGCFNAKVVKSMKYELSVECENDGEEGSVDLNTRTLLGSIYFYIPKLGYNERTLVDLTCRKLNW